MDKLHTKCVIILTGLLNTDTAFGRRCLILHISFKYKTYTYLIIFLCYVIFMCVSRHRHIIPVNVRV